MVAQALVIRANSEPLRLGNVPARLCDPLGSSFGDARRAIASLQQKESGPESRRHPCHRARPSSSSWPTCPIPRPGPGEVLVDVAYAGCNWADTQVRTGIYPHPMTYPLVLGFEVSGTVATLGPGVSGVKVGDRVATFPEKGGAYAEKVVAAATC